MLRKIHIWGLYIDVMEIILMCVMQIRKVVYPEYCGRLAHSMYLDEAVINTDLQKNVKIVSTDA